MFQQRDKRLLIVLTTFIITLTVLITQTKCYDENTENIYAMIRVTDKNVMYNNTLLYHIAACIWTCTKNGENLNACYLYCSTDEHMNAPINLIYKEHANENTTLICRDSSNIKFYLQHNIPSSRLIYVYHGYSLEGSPMEKFTYIAMQPLVRMSHLQPLTVYNFSVAVVNDVDVYPQDSFTFSTVSEEFIPGPVSNFKFFKYTYKRPTLGVTVQWDYSEDRSCFNDFSFQKLNTRGHEVDDIQHDLNIEVSLNEHGLYYTKMGLDFETTYRFGVIERNPIFKPKNYNNDSFAYFSKTTNECVFFDNTDVCGPSIPRNITTTEKWIVDNLYDITIHWAPRSKPHVDPQYFIVGLDDLISTHKNEKPVRITGDRSQYTYKSYELNSPKYIVTITALRNDSREATDFVVIPLERLPTPPESQHWGVFAWLCIIIAIIFIIGLAGYYGYGYLKRTHPNLLEHRPIHTAFVRYNIIDDNVEEERREMMPNSNINGDPPAD